MQATEQQIKKMLTGSQKFKQLGFSMLMTRLRSNYSRSPSQAVLKSCMDEINVFLDKYGNTMKDDCAVIEKL